MKTESHIPFHIPSVGDDEINEVVDSLRSGWLTTGPKTSRFEADFKSYVGCRHALALNSGTAALHLALKALDIQPGEEVITTPVTFCATVNTILHVGGTPVLADVGPDGNIDPEAIGQRITSRTRAIMPVHLAGLPCHMDAIWRLAKKNHLSVVEDAAHATGAFYRGHHVGSAQGQSDAVAFSFYATKNLTTGEGGMVVTNSTALDSRMRVLTLHGMTRDAWNRYQVAGKWRYDVVEPGFKYNLSDIQSAIGIHQLKRQEEFWYARAARADFYAEQFRDIEELETPVECTYGRHAWHLYILRLNLEKSKVDRDCFIEEMHRRGIGVSVHFIPIPLHPFFAAWAKLPQNECPQALKDFQRSVSLPLYPSLTESEQMRIVSAVKEIVTGRKQAPVPAVVAVGQV